MAPNWFINIIKGLLVSIVVCTSKDLWESFKREGIVSQLRVSLLMICPLMWERRRYKTSINFNKLWKFFHVLTWRTILFLARRPTSIWKKLIQILLFVCLAKRVTWNRCPITWNYIKSKPKCIQGLKVLNLIKIFKFKVYFTGETAEWSTRR